MRNRNLMTKVLLTAAVLACPLPMSYAAQKSFSTPQEVESLVFDARRGDALAQFRLGRAYETGKGTRQNYVEAARWYMQAANQGLPSAQFNLALLYEQGHGVKKDIAYALSWYEEAARNGLTSALDRLRKLTTTASR